MTGSQITEEAVTGSCTFRPFVHDATNVGAFIAETDQQHGDRRDSGRFLFIKKSEFIPKKKAPQIEKLFSADNRTRTYTLKHSIYNFTQPSQKQLTPI